MRFTPDIGFEITPRYAELIAHNLDTVQEAFKVVLPPGLVERLEQGKNDAIEAHEGQGQLFFFGGQEFQIWAGASQGNKWVLENDDIQIHFGAASRDWPVVVRYLSPGLWEHGFEAVKARVIDLLRMECVVKEKDLSDWCHVTRFDYCFDFYSPKFSAVMGSKRVREKVIAPSGVKMGVVGTSPRDETLTIGMSKGSLQIQVYDKGREIMEKSGKWWMLKVWEREGYYPKFGGEGIDPKPVIEDVWRLEVRFGKEFLKDRNIRTMDKAREALRELLAEALMTRRMVERPEGYTDENMRRWPLHPIWAASYDAAGRAGQYLPVGRKITMAREEYRQLLMKMGNGVIRASNVLDNGHYSRDYSKGMWEVWAQELILDPEHEKKVLKSVEKFRFLDEAH